MKIHIVRPGDTIHIIVQKYNIPLERLLEFNPHLNNADSLEAGMKIRIPTGKVHVGTKLEQTLESDEKQINKESDSTLEYEEQTEFDQEENDPLLNEEANQSFSSREPLYSYSPLPFTDYSKWSSEADYHESSSLEESSAIDGVDPYSMKYSSLMGPPMMPYPPYPELFLPPFYFTAPTSHVSAPYFSQDPHFYPLHVPPFYPIPMQGYPPECASGHAKFQKESSSREA
ncbi:LysM peptidoglycan-binding domain-containing protein [Thermoflavimicrobium dichotomicum]|uniref:LysM domain-containing protein n=1 Tax=Thermoflavimicrobium dichotomicum TaxID=46223 RepID=A0A1I3R8B8_9BACL|nr:LysM domain-containing protein [Thermoflavimicrobium dichotomicum]SFJ41476.1 LysM domain-containing protein [Thermoflavimicrobium dichotomicum]